MRGLKLKIEKAWRNDCTVASFTDAWIETLNNWQKESEKMSHLLQMRGLKRLPPESKRVCKVASFTDAWIETCKIPFKFR